MQHTLTYLCVSSYKHETEIFGTVIAIELIKGNYYNVHDSITDHLICENRFISELQYLLDLGVIKPYKERHYGILNKQLKSKL